MDKINGRTPEEIKRVLERCGSLTSCENCEYLPHACICVISPNILSYTNRLEETYRQLKKSLQDRGFVDFEGLFEAYEKLKSQVPRWVSVADAVPEPPGGE